MAGIGSLLDPIQCLPMGRTSAILLPLGKDAASLDRKMESNSGGFRKALRHRSAGWTGIVTRDRWFFMDFGIHRPGTISLNGDLQSRRDDGDPSFATRACATWVGGFREHQPIDARLGRDPSARDLLTCRSIWSGPLNPGQLKLAGVAGFRAPGAVGDP